MELQKEKIIDACTVLHKKYVNKKIDNPFEKIYDGNIYLLLKHTIMAVISNSVFHKSAIHIEEPVEFEMVIEAYKSITKNGYLK